jgi:hypothetical protein
VGLKKYMLYSFGTLWTAALVIALVATVVHQVRFQDSTTHMNLSHQLHNLQFENQKLSNSLEQSEIKYDNYRQWVMSWRY